MGIDRGRGDSGDQGEKFTTKGINDEPPRDWADES